MSIQTTPSSLGASSHQDLPSLPLYHLQLSGSVGAFADLLKSEEQAVQEKIRIFSDLSTALPPVILQRQHHVFEQQVSIMKLIVGAG